MTGDAITAASLGAALRIAAVQLAALAVACASRSGILLLTTWLWVEAGLSVAVVLSYTAWCLIFGLSSMSVVFV